MVSQASKVQLHLSAEDIGRVSIAPQADAMTELLISAQFLVRGRVPEPLGSQMRSGLTARSAPLLRLAATPGFEPENLTSGGYLGFSDGLDELLSRPSRDLLAALDPVRTQPWVRHTSDPRRVLAAMISSYHHEVFERINEHAAARVAADRAVRADSMATGGVERVLSTLHPMITWSTPMLSWYWQCASGDPVQIYLNGRGLRLVPSYYWFSQRPGWIDRQGAPIELIYAASSGISASPQDVAAALGRTRAAVLGAVRSGATTTQVAQRIGISLASASQHATVLRNAGFVTKTRRGRSVVHTLTPLGQSLNANRDSSPTDIDPRT